MDQRTPRRQYNATSYGNGTDFFTPPSQISLSRELKQVLTERNLLTAKSRRKVCTMLDESLTSTNSPHNSEMEKRKSFRLQAIQEILTSERSYLNQLELLMEFFVRPLKQQQIISSDQFMALFGQVEMIYNLNQELLSELETDLENVARAFKRMAPFFKLYSVYAFDYNRAQLILQELTEKNTTFKKFLETTESRPEVQRKLISLLIAPIQRVPRYRLLLQQVILYSSPCEADFKILQESIKEVESTVSHLNGVIQDQENTQNLLDLQNSLVSRLPSIVKPSRKVIKEGILQKMSSTGSKLKRYCVLMSDIFMYCKCLKERNKGQLVVSSLQCCCIFPLKKCRIAEIFPGTFKLTCQGDGIIFCAESTQVGRSWTAAIKETIEVHIQCRKTIRKGSSKRTPIRKKGMKYFETEEVMSPTRKKYDYESVFKCITDSDSDDSTAVDKCFNVNPVKLFKRKHSPVGLSSLCEESPSTAPFSFKNWFNHTNHNVQTSTPEHSHYPQFDPTYGFAKYNQNQAAALAAHELSVASSAGYQDVLYPLRTSTGSSKSASPSTSPIQQQTMTMHMHSVVPDVAPRKRVKFDISPHHQYQASVQSNYYASGEPYRFGNVRYSNNEPESLSLKNRILNFFSNLF